MEVFRRGWSFFCARVRQFCRIIGLQQSSTESTPTSWIDQVFASVDDEASKQLLAAIQRVQAPIQSLNQLREDSKKILRLAARHSLSMTMLSCHVGVFHCFRKSGRNKTDFDFEGEIPINWIARGYWPGIWCALGGPMNTKPIHTENIQLWIATIAFKEGYFVFDPAYDKHVDEWKSWAAISENLAKENIWETATNAEGQSLASRIDNGLCPGINHASFFREKNYGAVIGYSDYMGLVIIDQRAIQSLKERNYGGNLEDSDDDILSIYDTSSTRGSSVREVEEQEKGEESDAEERR